MEYENSPPRWLISFNALIILPFITTHFNIQLLLCGTVILFVVYDAI